MTNWAVSQTGRPDLTETVRSSVDLIASRIDNCEDGLSGTKSLNNIQTTGGNIDGTVIGATSAVAGSFTDIVGTKLDIDNIKIDGNTISSVDTDGDINLVPDGDGDINLTTGVGRTKISRLIGDTGAEQNLQRVNNGTATSNVTVTKDVQVVLYKSIMVQTVTASRTSTVSFFSDASSPSTTQYHAKSQTAVSSGTYTDWLGFSFIVKKGNTYTITVNNGGDSITTTAYWREIEIGA